MEKLKFQEVLEVCNNFIKDPSDDNNKALIKLQSELVVRSFLRTEEKVASLQSMIADTNDMPKTAPTAVFTIKLEIACCFRGLFAYTNIDMFGIPTALLTYEAYDAIYQSGLADYILQYCGRDYDRLVRLMERCLSYQNLVELVDSISLMDSDALKQVTDEFERFRLETDPQILKDISDIVRYNDPGLYHIKESILDDALDQVDRMDVLEKIKKAEDAENK